MEKKLSLQPSAKPPMRSEKDTIGNIEVPADRYFGAQTMRCVNNFPIGGMDERMPVIMESDINLNLVSLNLVTLDPYRSL